MKALIENLIQEGPESSKWSLNLLRSESYQFFMKTQTNVSSVALELKRISA